MPYYGENIAHSDAVWLYFSLPCKLLPIEELYEYMIVDVYLCHSICLLGPIILYDMGNCPEELLLTGTEIWFSIS